MRIQLAISRCILYSFVVAAAVAVGDCASAEDANIARDRGGPVFVDTKTATVPDKEDAAQPRRRGRWIRIPLPIDNNTVVNVTQTMQRAIAAAHDERPIFVLEFVAPEGAADAGQGTQFDDAHKLARFSAIRN